MILGKKKLRKGDPLIIYYRSGSRISGKVVNMDKGVGVRLANFISLFLNNQ